jgi:hypothetical protein
VAVSAGALAVLWMAVLAWFPSQRRMPIRRGIWYTMLLLSVIGTLDLPGISGRLDRLCRLPNASDVTQHVLAIIAATLAWHSVVSILGPEGRPARPSAIRWIAAPAVTIAALIGLFAVSPARTEPTDVTRYTDFPMQFAAHPAAVAYWLIFTGYLGTALVVIGRLTFRYGKAVPGSPLGRGLLLVAGGMAAGLVYLGYGTAVLAVRVAGYRGPFVTTAPNAIQGSFGAMLVLVAVGCVLPAAQHWPGVRHAALYWSLRRLYPLWRGLCEAVPGIALNPVPAWADRFDPRDLHMRLYRRVIEIRDGYLALRPVDMPGIEDRVLAVTSRRLSAADHAVIAAATRLELARRAELRGEPPAGAGIPSASREFLAGADLDSEVRLLRVVATHWATISALAERIERETGTPASSPALAHPGP